MSARASSIEQAFKIFDEKISLNTQEREEAHKRARLISQALEKEEVISECLLAGSLIKTTALSGLSDVDIVAILSNPPTHDESSPRRAIAQVRKAVQSHYPGAGESGNAIHVAFESGPQIDILPAFLAQREDGPQFFLIPDESLSNWQRYSPAEQIHQLRAASTKLGPDFKRLIRIVKWWSKQHRTPISSYDIETLAKECFSTEMPRLSVALVQFFKFASRSSHKYTGSEAALKEACNSAEEALALDSANYVARASGVWRRLLGEEFPAITSRGDCTR